MDTIQKDKPYRPKRATSRTLVKQIALQFAKDTRPFWPVTRVSGEFLEAVEAATMAFIRHRVSSHPTKGQTLT